MGACLNKGKNIIIKSEMEKLGKNNLSLKLNIKKRESSNSLEYQSPKNNQKEQTLTTFKSSEITSEININDINSIESIINNNNTVKEIIDIFHYEQ